MNWNEILDRMRSNGLDAVEETYMENYGKILTAERPEFRERYFRCAYGILRCNGISVEAFLFPSESQLQDFVEVVGSDPWRIPVENVLLHFPPADPAIVDSIVQAVSKKSGIND